MARLIPNPIGDIAGPLHRVERSLDGLNGELAALRMLPEIRDQLVEVNAGLRELLTAIHALQETAQAPPA